jgi:hypothetical protein
MRTSAVRTKVMLAVASSLGMLFVMGRPWYGERPVPGPDASLDPLSSLDAYAATMARWFTDPLGTSAWQAFELTDLALAASAILAATAAAACLSREFQDAARRLLQLAAVSSCVLLAVRFVDQPGDNGGVEPRYGLFAALALAVLLLVNASAINAAAPLRRQKTSSRPRTGGGSRY